MKWKWTVPYLLTCASLLVGGMTTAGNEHEPDGVSHDISVMPKHYTMVYNASLDRQINEMRLDSKADSLRDKYIDNMLRAQEKLHPLMGRHGYRAAVRAELPGAPVGLHCVYGQYTHLNRALDEMGDTLTIIPRGGHASCVGFMYHMNNKYNKPEFPDCIHNGVMHESDSAYNAALDRYLARNKVAANTPDSVRAQYMKKFAVRNFSADALDSGSILIVPRYRGSRSTFHAVMYLGRGQISQGKFIPDSMGRHIYVGHNRENLGDLFKTYDVSNVFAADTRKIVRAEYANELKRIESMDSTDLVAFLSDEQMPAFMLHSYPRNTLVRMARDKYFKHLDINAYKPIVAESKVDIPATSLQLSQQFVRDLKLNQKTM
ncbi:MAG: hypothetical protein IJE82_00950 [Alphaproteobacteria bacterium]|nr:hypothetical protein [Alphaproteobacteria bacterium]